MKGWEGWQEMFGIFWLLGKLNYAMRDRWQPSGVTLPLCPVWKWPGGPEWRWEPLRGKMRQHPPCPTAHNMSSQPHTYICTFSISRAQFLLRKLRGCRALVWGEGCRHPARRPGRLVACLQPPLHHRTHLSILNSTKFGFEGNFCLQISRASNI